MMLDLGAVAEQPLFVLGMALALIATKAAILFGLARLFRMDTRHALKVGLLLSQGGEFAFVLFAAAQSALLIRPEAASLFSAIVTVSMATTPFLMKFNAWFDRRGQLGAGKDMEGPEKSEETSAIVIGYGRFGQTVAQMLMAKGISLTLIDSKPSQIELSGDFGMKVYYGDGTRLDLLRAAGAGDARALLFCVDGSTLDGKKLEPILEAFPQASVYVRAFDRRHLMALDSVDVAGTYREVFESAVHMGRDALKAFCVSEEEVERVESEFRSRDAERLRGQSQSGDLHDTEHLMFKPDRPLPDDEPAEARAG
jgi:glutathione-regulated potassium-efflux system protein KefB